MAQTRGERINPITEIQQQFKGVWPAIRRIYAARYGQSINWPDGFSPVNAQGYSVDFYARQRSLQFQQPGLEKVVSIIFSRRGDDVSGITLVEPGREEHVGEGTIRDKISHESGYPVRTHLWHTDGNLREVRSYLSEELGFRYHDENGRGPDWLRVRVPNEYANWPLPQDIDKRFPRILAGHAVLDGIEVPWKINVQAKAEEVIQRSGVRNIKFEIPG